MSWAREAPRDARAGAARRHLDRPAGLPEEPAILRDAIREFFAHRAQTTRRRLRQLLRVGRTSLAIGARLPGGLASRSGTSWPTRSAGSAWARSSRESLLIGGWVAMWRPLEIFLYDWWPIRAEAQPLRPAERDAGAHRLHGRRDVRSVALGLAGGAPPQTPGRRRASPCPRSAVSASPAFPGAGGWPGRGWRRSARSRSAPRARRRDPRCAAARTPYSRAEWAWRRSRAT